MKKTVKNLDKDVDWNKVSVDIKRDENLCKSGIAILKRLVQYVILRKKGGGG